MSSKPSDNKPLRIPKPNLSGMEQLAQLASYDGVLNVYWVRDIAQVLLEFNDRWYTQNDGYITDSIAEILAIKESTITFHNLRTSNLFDPAKFKYADDEMSNGIYICTWSDYACDYMCMRADLDYPYDD